MSAGSSPAKITPTSSGSMRVRRQVRRSVRFSAPSTVPASSRSSGKLSFGRRCPPAAFGFVFSSGVFPAASAAFFCAFFSFLGRTVSLTGPTRSRTRSSPPKSTIAPTRSSERRRKSSRIMPMISSAVIVKPPFPFAVRSTYFSASDSLSAAAVSCVGSRIAPSVSSRSWPSASSPGISGSSSSELKWNTRRNSFVVR